MNREKLPQEPETPSDEPSQGWEHFSFENIYGDIDVIGILNPETSQAFENINEQLHEDFLDIKTSHNYDEFASRLREFYQNDKDALKTVNEALAGMESKYQADLRKYKAASQSSSVDSSVFREFLNTLREQDPLLATRFIGHRPDKQARSLYMIASFLKGTCLDEIEPFLDLKRTLEGKKILVLGDDTGSLSEILHKYGAESYGIEIDKFKLLVAHSGVLSQDGQPQDQVLEGSIGDFFHEDETPLLKKLKELGPFDMIVSDNVFNSGSGIEKLPSMEAAIDLSYYNERRLPEDEVFKNLRSIRSTFQRNNDSLLNENGLQLHLKIDYHGGSVFRDNYMLRRADDWEFVAIPKNMIRKTH